MEIQRVSNAGVLVALDGVLLLLDGVCRELSPYLAPPPTVIEELERRPPDMLAYTHSHPDHFEQGFAARFYKKTRRPILGTAGVSEQLPGISVEQGSIAVGGVRVTPIPSRHLGAEWSQYPHVSYLIEGSKRIFFVGDAAPLCWKDGISRLRPDALIVPYPYVISGIGRQTIARFAPKAVMAVHTPAKGLDPDGVWPMMGRALKKCGEFPVYAPDLCETVSL